MRLEIDHEIDAPRSRVWEVLTDWERQAEWMLDARAVYVLTPAREGPGVTIRCPTNLLAVTVHDVMRVTQWDPPRRLEVVHLGRIITGHAGFDLESTPEGRCVVRWWEQVTPPLGRIGEWAASRLVLPVLERVFRRSLERLADIVEPPG